jgi:thioredoxin-dependent peroxiredoxin
VGAVTDARLSPGDPAPDFTLPDADGKPVSLSDHRGRHTIVYFYPAASTPGCTTQACDFRDSMASLQGAGYTVLGVSPDPPAKLARFRDEQSLTFPLLSDPAREVLTAWGAYGDKTRYGKTVQGVIRSTVVVDPEGRVEKAMYNVKATGHVAKLRRELGLP